jgi:hypothetical protein
MADTPKTIRVRAAPHRKDDPRAILNDQDERHPTPDGHIYIVGTDRQAHTVGDTSRVRELIASGDLVLVEDKEPRAIVKEPASDATGKP